MAFNPYETCICGSGKKLKWCCQNIVDRVSLAMTYAREGQPESAIREMEGLVAERSKNPAVHTFYAEVLLRLGDDEGAEKQLEEALVLDPQNALVQQVRGLKLIREGENKGGLMLLRKAALLFHEEATRQLRDVYEQIASCENFLLRPLFAVYALRKAVEYDPDDLPLRQNLQAMLTDGIVHSEAMSMEFRPTVKPLAESSLGRKPEDIRDSYLKLAEITAIDPAVWFNIGLAQLYLGETVPAMEALQRSLELEYNEELASKTGLLLEHLRLASADPRYSDFVLHENAFEIVNDQSISEFLRQEMATGRLLEPQFDEEQRYFTAICTEEAPSLVEMPFRMMRQVGLLTMGYGRLNISGLDPEKIALLVNRLRETVTLSVRPLGEAVNPLTPDYLVRDWLPIPVVAKSSSSADFQSLVEQKISSMLETTFESHWLEKPSRSLDNRTPLEAKETPLGRKRLLGVLEMYREVIEQSPIHDFYPFSKIEELLQLDAVAPGEMPEELQKLQSSEPLITRTKKTQEPPKREKFKPQRKAPPVSNSSKLPSPELPKCLTIDFGTIDAEQLRTIDFSKLTVAEIDLALRAAIRFNERELAVKIAQAGVEKAHSQEHPDRYTLYSCLVTASLARGETDQALSWLDQGLAFDLAHNQGLKAHDYFLKKGQILLKAGETEPAAECFSQVLQRRPENPRYTISAIEAMLGARQGKHAEELARLGLENARQAGNRDLQDACHELLEAANRYS